MFSPFSVTTGWLRSYLTNILGEFIKKECFESLTASLWHGTLVIENAELQETILDSLGLPISLRRGTVGRLEVTVPWTSITTSSIVIRLQNLELVADARYDFADEIARCLRARALAELEAQKKAAAEKKIRVDPTVEDKEAEPGMLGRLGTTILDNLLVIVAGVHIRVEDRVTCPQVPFAYGFTADSITYRVRGALRCRLQSVVFENAHCD